MASNIIQFSLPQADLKKLESLGIDGENSLNLTAKRLLNSILNNVDLDIPEDTAKTLGDRLAQVEKMAERLADIELCLTDLAQEIAAIPRQETAILVEKKPRGRRPKVASND